MSLFAIQKYHYTYIFINKELFFIILVINYLKMTNFVIRVVYNIDVD